MHLCSIHLTTSRLSPLLPGDKGAIPERFELTSWQLCASTTGGVVARASAGADPGAIAATKATRASTVALATDYLD